MSSCNYELTVTLVNWAPLVNVIEIVWSIVINGNNWGVASKLGSLVKDNEYEPVFKQEIPKNEVQYYNF